MVVHLSLEDARRIAVRAQLLGSPPPTDLVDTVAQLTFVQIEPTAPIAPTADLVMWSRLGSRYTLGELQATTNGSSTNTWSAPCTPSSASACAQPASGTARYSDIR